MIKSTFLSVIYLPISFFTIYIVKPVNKGHPKEIKNMVFIDKWS